MRYISIVTLILLCCIFILCNVYKPEKTYKIIKIKSAAQYYIDFNNNNAADEEELVELSSLQPFELTIVDYKSPLFKKNITTEENVQNYYQAEKWLNENLLNKKVKVEFLSTSKPQIGRIYLGNKDIAQIVLEKGFAVVKDLTFDFNRYAKFENIALIRQNALNAADKKIYILNNKNKKYHALTCEYGLMTKDYRILKESELPRDVVKCNICLREKEEDVVLVEKNDEPPLKLAGMEVFLLDFTRHPKANKECKNYSCKALLQLVHNAEKSIDLALYSFHNQKMLLDELIAAQNRGVKIRFVVEGDNYKQYVEDMDELHKYFSDIKNDNLSPKKNHQALMHNKFIVVDDKYVCTGSANISRTDLSGFNANIMVIINSAEVVNAYKSEFEQMFSDNLYHKTKRAISSKQNIKMNDETLVSVYFSPADAVIKTEIIPLINNAKKYIYIPIFVLTHKEMSKALVEAKKRNIDVRIILDATSAWNKYSMHEDLRRQKILVKVENLAGKMHMKSIIIDDEITVLGSMNYTYTAEEQNDENVLIIKNSALAKYYKQYFLYLWKFIPDKWLTKNPHSESFDSIGSCFDGIDNDFDGLVDAEDEGCQKIHKHPH